MLWPAPATAQEEVQAGPTWWLVISEQVKPAMQEQYETASAEIMELVRANATDDIMFYTLSGSETGYVFAIPMAGMESFTKVNAAWEAMVEEAGRDEWMEISSRSDEAVTSRSMNFFVERSELSYEPASPRLTEEEAVMRHYDWIYVTPGKDSDLEGIFREWVELYKANDVDSGWTTFQAVTGNDLPLYVISTPAASRADYETNGDQLDELLGEAQEDLMNRGWVLMRDFKHNDAWMRPDMSVVPEGM
jgi:hypothetical protein